MPMHTSPIPQESCIDVGAVGTVQQYTACDIRAWSICDIQARCRAFVTCKQGAQTLHTAHTAAVHEHMLCDACDCLLSMSSTVSYEQSGICAVLVECKLHC